MHIYRLEFKGTGFLMSMPPDGQVIDRFTCTMFLKSSSESCARETALAALHAHPTVVSMIQESREAEVESWSIECESVTRLGFWRHLLPLPKQRFDTHWMEEQTALISA
jgi:hypothetical protein